MQAVFDDVAVNGPGAFKKVRTGGGTLVNVINTYAIPYRIKRRQQEGTCSSCEMELPFPRPNLAIPGISKEDIEAMA